MAWRTRGRPLSETSDDSGPSRRGILRRYGLTELYWHAAKQGAMSRNPVVVLPGVMGSRLAQPTNGRVMWGATKREYARQTIPEEAQAIAHPLCPGTALSEMETPLVADGVVRRLHIRQAGFSFCLDAYGTIMQTLGVGGYSNDRRSRRAAMLPYGHQSLATAFEFDYDWRLSIERIAAQLMQFIRQVAAFAQKESGSDKPVRVDVVAHSMGGLIVRYMLRYGEQLLTSDGALPRLDWSGAQLIDHVMYVGTPNGGSLDALNVLLVGLRSNAAVPRYDAAMLATLPSVYQILPRMRHEPLVERSSGRVFRGLYDPDAWVELGWGLGAKESDVVLERLLPDVSDAAERRRIGLDHLAKCLEQAQRFHRAIDQPATPPSHLYQHMFIGDRFPTARTAEIDPSRRMLRIVETAPGDKRVLRSSAVLDDRLSPEDGPRVSSALHWDGITFLPTHHMQLTRDRTFVDQVLWHLLEKPRSSQQRAQAGTNPESVEAKLRISGQSPSAAG